MTKRNNWVTVDLDGLAKTLGRNGKNFILSELLRNAWDEAGVTEVHVVATRKTNQIVELSVADNSPNGFRNLADAYTLFADSYKKDNPNVAGRFNAGEKFVLALCQSAIITSTTGQVIFDSAGRSTNSRKKSERGTSITCKLLMSGGEFDVLTAFAETLLTPQGIETTFNGKWLMPRKPLAKLAATLTTEQSNGEGILRRVKRGTSVNVVEPREGEEPMLYELGIPVMPLECKWHVDVQQKVPLTMERDAVPVSFIKEINVLLLNELNTELSHEDATANWVRDGAGNKLAKPEAVTKVMDLRFGEKRVAYDPSDKEANLTAASQGYTIVHGGSLSKSEWANVRTHEAIKPAGQVAPTYQPYGAGGEPAVFVPESDWSAGMQNIARFIEIIARRTIDKFVVVRFEKGRKADRFSANYGHQCLTWNLDKVGKAVFDRGRSDPWLNEIIIHELAHQFGGHLTEEFDDALARIGAKMISLALTEPKIFR